VREFVVIGGGIAGCSTAYFLKKAGFKVTLFEKNTICSGGSYPAGAFLSPKLSKPSPYKEYLNTALEFSLNFYEKNFPDIFKRVPLHKYPKDKKDWQKLLSYEEFIEFEYEKKEDFFILNFAGIVEPVKLCYRLLEGIEYHENCEITSLEEFKDKTIIIAHPNQNYFDTPYIKTKDIGGYRYDVLFDGYEKKEFNSHHELSISCFFQNRVAIGATYIRGEKDLECKAKSDSEELLKKAQNFYPLKNLKVLKHYTGYRNMTFDYFPIVGKLIDSKATLQKYPYIKKGTKVPPSKYIYHDNIYIHTALGSRGFVYAPYNAKLLVKNITTNNILSNKLSPIRLFIKFSKNYLKTTDILPNKLS